MTDVAADSYPSPLTGSGALAGVNDVRSRVASLTAKQPVSPKFEAAFVASRYRIARTHPFATHAERDLRLDILDARIGRPQADLVGRPTPGGVGYGTFYSDAFKAAFDGGSELLWNIVCPDVPGGNVDTYLYLTATNRTSMGVEALVGYEPNGAIDFFVYDWALPDTVLPGQTSSQRWTVSLTRADLQPYLATIPIDGDAGGVTAQVLSVINSTVEVAAGRWRNVVLLFNHLRNGWDQAYSYDYDAALSAQKAVWVGGWGPIVETFQTLFAGTNKMGANNVQLRARNGGAWSAWTRLDGQQSTLRADHLGFRQILLDPNYDWVVDS